MLIKYIIKVFLYLILAVMTLIRWLLKIPMMLGNILLYFLSIIFILTGVLSYGFALESARECGRMIIIGMLTMLQGRRLEQNVMEIMPFGISLYIAAAYPGYFGTLYHNGMGIIVMTLCLAVYAGAYLLGEKILDRIEEEL